MLFIYIKRFDLMGGLTHPHFCKLPYVELKGCKLLFMGDFKVSDLDNWRSEPWKYMSTDDK